MPLQNRVTPFGEIIVTPAHGTFMGNRGILHDDQRRLGRARWRHKSWVTCRLQHKGIRRDLMAPGNYTELFFLDEATALAAGHRPAPNAGWRISVRSCRHGRSGPIGWEQRGRALARSIHVYMPNAWLNPAGASGLMTRNWIGCRTAPW